ncbi:MAG: hypothetical protein EON48_14475, partial [Acetobacteraceae bacterium]
MSEFREILVLGLGRSGSNLLTTILRNVEGNAGFYEIFFDTKAQGLQHHPTILDRVGARLGVAAPDAESPALLAARDADPVAFFDAVSAEARAAGFQSMSCKIFARQISIGNLERLLKRPGISVIFLTRSRIDRYISELKGTITQSYVKEDTTALRPRLDLRKFLSTAFRQDRDLDKMQEAVGLSCVPQAHIDYSRDLDLPEAARVQAVARVLRAVGAEPVFTKTETEGWIVKQDTNTDWRDKIENGFEVASALAGLGLQTYAEAAPLTGKVPLRHQPGAVMPEPREPSLLDEGGYNIALSADPVITFTAIQYGRSFLAEWMGGQARAFGARRGVHFLKPTWTMETTDLAP